MMRNESSLTGLKLSHALAVRLFKESGTSPLASESVRLADLSEVASETWRDSCLRKGHPEIPLSEAAMRLSLVRESEAGGRNIGFKVELSLPAGQTSARLFTIHSIRHVAERAVGPLVEREILRSGENYFFDVIAGDESPATTSKPLTEIPIHLSVRSKPLAYLTLPLRPLLERATPVALLDDEALPVFYTESAFAKAESCARRGIASGVETGGALFGSLAACPESGEFFAIVDDVIEIEDAEEKKFSLAYSSQSWQRLQAIQHARQIAFPARGDRLLGQTHCHPFRPNDGNVCAECARRPVCTLSSAWASEDDQLWHKAVFARQPWAMCHIFGLTARGDASDRLFGLADGRLQARGFYLLPDFEIPPNSTFP